MEDICVDTVENVEKKPVATTSFQLVTFILYIFAFF